MNLSEGGLSGLSGSFPTLREKLSVRYRSNVRCNSGDSIQGGAETDPLMSLNPPDDAFDLQEERLAIQSEADLAVPQSIPNAVMIAGLMRVAANHSFPGINSQPVDRPFDVSAPDVKPTAADVASANVSRQLIDNAGGFVQPLRGTHTSSHLRAR